MHVQDLHFVVHLADKTDRGNSYWTAEAELAALGVMLGMYHLPGSENDESLYGED